MKVYVPARDVHFRKLARERIVISDLFTYAVAVVPIKTKKQYYGSISRAVAAKNIPFPELALGCAEYVEVSPGSGFIFVALWNDNKPLLAVPRLQLHARLPQAGLAPSPRPGRFPSARRERAPQVHRGDGTSR